MTLPLLLLTRCSRDLRRDGGVRGRGHRLQDRSRHLVAESPDRTLLLYTRECFVLFVVSFQNRPFFIAILRFCTIVLVANCTRQLSSHFSSFFLLTFLPSHNLTSHFNKNNYSFRCLDCSAGGNNIIIKYFKIKSSKNNRFDDSKGKNYVF